MGKKPIVSVTYENERISIKNSLPYLKCVLGLSCVVHVQFDALTVAPGGGGGYLRNLLVELCH